MSDQYNTEISTWQHITLTSDRHPCLPVGFKPANPASKQLLIHTWDHAATGTDPHPSYAAVIWQMVKHDQKYTESYYTKSHYSKTQTNYPNARLHTKIIYNIFPLKHPDLHVKNKHAFSWFTVHGTKTIQLTNSSSNVLNGIWINSLNALQSI